MQHDFWRLETEAIHLAQLAVVGLIAVEVGDAEHIDGSCHISVEELVQIRKVHLRSDRAIRSDEKGVPVGGIGGGLESGQLQVGDLQWLGIEACSSNAKAHHHLT